MGEKQRKAIRGRLRKEAESQGVDGRRIVWAGWVSKSEHLLRHALADLFLDTLTYGAHSTATDALAGGLPFLTLAGASWRHLELAALWFGKEFAQVPLYCDNRRDCQTVKGLACGCRAYEWLQSHRVEYYPHFFAKVAAQASSRANISAARATPTCCDSLFSLDERRELLTVCLGHEVLLFFFLRSPPHFCRDQKTLPCAQRSS